MDKSDGMDSSHSKWGDCLFDSLQFLRGHPQTLLNCSLVNRQFFRLVKGQLYRENARLIGTIFIGCEFFKDKFAFQSIDVDKSGEYSDCHESHRLWHYCDGRWSTVLRKSFPETKPPRNILGFSRIVIDEFVGPETFKFLKLSKRLFVGRSCSLDFYGAQLFWHRHGFRKLNQFFALFQEVSFLHVELTDEYPFDVLLVHLLDCRSVTLQLNHNSVFYERNVEGRAREEMQAKLAKNAVDNLISWLHHNPGRTEAKFLIFSDQILAEKKYFDQFVKLLKKRFAEATEACGPCPFTITCGQSTHYYCGYTGAIQLGRAGTERLEWHEREENGKSGEVFEHFTARLQAESRGVHSVIVIVIRRALLADQREYGVKRLFNMKSAIEADFDVEVEVRANWKNRNKKFK